MTKKIFFFGLLGLALAAAGFVVLLSSPAGVTPLHRCYCGRTFGFTAGCFLPGDSEGGRVTCIEMPRGSGE